ncbi:MAG: RNA polymerase factor sigma-54 [Candidatus Aminicenantes bacterium]|nr:RNA polymerase factor sigma-54 [Candidatus Aminicenantes bacterium]
MKQKQNIELQQKTTLKLFNEVRLYLDLLPLTYLELSEKIEEAIEQNPALEIVNEEPDNELSLSSSSDGAEFFEHYYENDEEENDPPEALIPYIPNAREKIRKNYLPHFTEERERKVAEAIIDYIDSKGFLDERSFSMVVEETKETSEFVEKVRQKLMLISPCGIGSSGVVEALRVQLKANGKEESLPWKLLEPEMIELLKKRDYDVVASKLGCSLSDLKNAIEEIQKLNPFPASIFNDKIAEHVDVDIILEEKDGELKVKIIEKELPPVRINPFYLKILEDPDADSDLVKFAREKVRSAQWFLNALIKRRVILRKTVEYIVNRQREFFEKGYNPQFLKPLNLKEVASAVGVHESTISRIVSTRFIATPRGTYRLKFFFPSSAGGYRGNISNASIKEMVRKIIETEPREDPYSDEEITSILARRGVYISRRTVAKYRDELGIESVNKRKKKYRLEVSE